MLYHKHKTLTELLMIPKSQVSFNSSLKSCYNNTYQNSIVVISSINIAGICTSPPPPAETTPIRETLSSTVISWTCNQNSVTFSNKTGTSC